MGNNKEDKYEDGIDVVIPLSTLDAALVQLIKCETSETHDVLCCFVEWRMKKYFDDCLKNAKKKSKRRGKCEFETSYRIIGQQIPVDDDEEEEDEEEEQQEQYIAV